MSTEPGLPDRTRHLGVDDTSALRALAHPARLAILGSLRVGGPATVGSLAAAHGLAAGSASYHLATLARHGFVEEATATPDGGAADRRTRWWRAAARTTHWDPADFDASPAGAAAAHELARSVLDLQHQRAVDALARRDELDEGWREAQHLSDDVVWLSLDDTAALREDIEALMVRWRERSREAGSRAGARPVALVVHTFPDVTPRPADETAPRPADETAP